MRRRQPIDGCRRQRGGAKQTGAQREQAKRLRMQTTRVGIVALSFLMPWSPWFYSGYVRCYYRNVNILPWVACLAVCGAVESVTATPAAGAWGGVRLGYQAGGHITISPSIQHACHGGQSFETGGEGPCTAHVQADGHAALWDPSINQCVAGSGRVPWQSGEAEGHVTTEPGRCSVCAQWHAWRHAGKAQCMC